MNDAPNFVDASKDVLDRLCATLFLRKNADPGTSYAASLFAKGQDALLKKIGEEAAELIMASKDNKVEKIVYETGDLVFHILALLAFHGLSIEDIRHELERREGVSGLKEKAAREKG